MFRGIRGSIRSLIYCSLDAELVRGYHIEFCSEKALQFAAESLCLRHIDIQSRLMNAAYSGMDRTLAGRIFERLFIDFLSGYESKSFTCRTISNDSTEVSFFLSLASS